MAICAQCGKDRFKFNMGTDGICLRCTFDKNQDARNADGLVERGDLGAHGGVPENPSHIVLTTETAHNLAVKARLEIVTAEVVIGMHLFKDIASAWRDTFGGRSKIMQEGLREARVTALSELRKEALSLGADAVVGVSLDYSEISGGGKSMLFLVASGTAVTLAEEP